MTYSKGCGRKQWLPNFKFCPDICLEDWERSGRTTVRMVISQLRFQVAICMQVEAMPLEPTCSF